MITNVTACIIEVCAIYKVDESKNLTDEEIKFVSKVIISEYYFLRFSQLIEFVGLCKRGRFGKVYGSLDTATLFQMLDTYCESLTTRASIGHVQKNEQSKKEPLSEETLKMIQDVKSKLKVNRAASYEPKENTENEVVNQFRLDFIELLKKESDSEASRRGFITIQRPKEKQSEEAIANGVTEYYDVKMNLMMYIQYRYENQEL